MKILTHDDVTATMSILKHGGIVAFPTETVYGLGVKANDEVCFNKLVEIKHRRPDQPFTVMCSDIKMIEKNLVVSEKTEKLINKFMPGPLTLILKVKNKVPHYIDYGTGFVGVRIPNDKFILDVINSLGVSLLVPSANPTGLPPALSSNEVIKYFDNKLDAVIDGECKSNTPSTIIKIDGDEISLIRQGEIPFEKILEVFK